MTLDTDQRRIVDVLVAARCKPVEIGDLAGRTGFKPRSTKFKAALRSLSRLGLVHARKGTYTATAAYGRLMSR